MFGASLATVTAGAGTAQAQCGIGGDVYASEVLTEASIPSLSALERTQIVLAVQESAHTDVTTVEMAFDRVDEGLINSIVLYNDFFHQYYLEIEFGAGDNSYGAIFYYGTESKAAAIHDGFQEECGGSAIYDYDDGDIAIECDGFVHYVNTVSFAALDAYLPSNVAQAIVDARAAHPLDSVASLLAVPGVGETRLQQIYAAAVAAEEVSLECSGIYDDLAISIHEEARMVEWVNTATPAGLQGLLWILIDETVIDHLLADRPYTSAAELSATYRVGPATFRTLRNGSISHPNF